MLVPKMQIQRKPSWEKVDWHARDALNLEWHTYHSKIKDKGLILCTCNNLLTVSNLIG